MPSGQQQRGAGAGWTNGVAVLGVILVVLGVAGVAWGATYLAGALAPDNATNALRDVGVMFGVAALVAGALPVLLGVALVLVGRRR